MIESKESFINGSGDGQNPAAHTLHHQLQEQQALYISNIRSSTEKESIVEEYHESLAADDEEAEASVIDPDFDKEGYGMLNPFKHYDRCSDEPVDIRLVKDRSHKEFTFH